MKGSLFAALLLASAPAGAAETAAFLDLGPGARAAAMGGAYTALADDAHALYWNPAGLARMEKREAAASHAELGDSIRHDFLSYAVPTEHATLAAGFTHLTQGAIQGRDSAGRVTSDFQASDSALAVAAGRKTDLADLGASVKYIRSHIASTEAQGLALDLGARRSYPLRGGSASIGAALRNIGPGLKYDNERNDLPFRLAVGAAWRSEKGHALAAEVQNGAQGSGREGGLGGEFQAYPGFWLRAGWTSKSAAMGGTGFDAARGLTMGLGFKRGSFGLDYAAQAAGELGNVHRFTLAWRH